MELKSGDRLVGTDSPFQSSLRKASMVNPASRTMPPMVKAFTGSLRGIVTQAAPLDITMCLEPCRET